MYRVCKIDIDVKESCWRIVFYISLEKIKDLDIEWKI